MLKYTIKRLLYGLLVLLGVVTLVFFLFNILPGDPARMMLGQRADAESIEIINRDLGRDKPVGTQYINYLKEMDDLNIEVDTEFIVLAAVLIRLKSHMLLPRVTESGEIMIEEDPREELRGRLLEYVRTKKIAEMLAEREEYFLAVLRTDESFFLYFGDDKGTIAAEDYDIVHFRTFASHLDTLFALESPAGKACLIVDV